MWNAYLTVNNSSGSGGGGHNDGDENAYGFIESNITAEK